MHLRKKLLITLLLTSMVVGMLHIGEYNNQQTEESKRQSYYTTETVYLWYTEPNFTDYFTNAAVEFHSKNPDIRVIPMLVDSEEYLEKINRSSVEGVDYPDLYVVTNDSLERAYLAGLASEARDGEHVLNNYHFSPSALSATTCYDKIIAYPLSFETSVLMYNKTYLEDYISKVKEDAAKALEDAETDEENEDLIDEETVEDEVKELKYDIENMTLQDLIPASFDDIKYFADVYDAPEGVDGIMKWSVSDIFFNYCFVGSSMIVGGDAGDDTENIDICNVDTLNCLTVYQGLSQFFSIDAKNTDYDSVLDDFLEGKTIFTIVTSDAIPVVQKKIADREAEIEELTIKRDDYIRQAEEAKKAGGDYEELEKMASKITFPKEFEYGYAQIPDLTDGLASRSLSVTDVVVVNGYSEVKAAANKFAAFVTTEYSPNIYSRTGRLASSVDAGYTDEALLTFQLEYADSIPLPKIVESSNLWVQLEITLAEIWQGADINEKLEQFDGQLRSQLIQ